MYIYISIFLTYCLRLARLKSTTNGGFSVAIYWVVSIQRVKDGFGAWASIPFIFI